MTLEVFSVRSAFKTVFVVVVAIFYVFFSLFLILNGVKNE